MAKSSHKHVNNNHKKLKFNEIKDLKNIEEQLSELYKKIAKAYSNVDFSEISTVLSQQQDLFNSVNEKINKQIERTRSEESSPKNTTLYFGLLTETKNLITATMNLLQTYKDHQ